MTQSGMLKRWRLPADREGHAAACEELVRNLGVHRLVAHLLCHRGCEQPQLAEAFLRPKLLRLHDPALMPGMTRAADRLARAVRERQPIVIYGDYDVDGVTASAILWHVLREAGADVHTYVPHRLEEGYGLNRDAIAELAAGRLGHVGGEEGEVAGGGAASAAAPVTLNGKPVIVSVDCGITAVEPARVAKDAGVDLIITDHHEFDPDRLPDAYALVHPRLEPSAHPTSHIPHPTSTYPFPHLCGAGVAFKLAWQFARVHCGSDRLPLAFRELLLDLLSLAALGTVADIVPLVDENRVITTFGLGQIKRTRFAGLNALIDAAGLRDEKIGAYHVGFILGPRLNACGRMGHARQAVHLLTRAQPREAAALAEFLTLENDRRRATERRIFEEARQMVLDAGYDRADCRAIVIGKEGWHPGVVGIVASRLVEAFSRPVVMLNVDAEHGEAHGSARSVDGISIHDAFASCAAHLSSFGGHAMAAGLRLDSGRLDDFRRALVGYVNERLAPEQLVGVLCIDAECGFEELTVDAVEQLQRLAPFGRENPTPVLCARDLRLERPAQRMGGEGRHLSMILRQGPRLLRAVWWGMGDMADRLPAGARLDAAFEPQISTWNGARSVELHLRDICLLPVR